MTGGGAYQTILTRPRTVSPCVRYPAGTPDPAASFVPRRKVADVAGPRGGGGARGAHRRGQPGALGRTCPTLQEDPRRSSCARSTPASGARGKSYAGDSAPPMLFGRTKRSCATRKWTPCSSPAATSTTRAGDGRAAGGQARLRREADGADRSECRQLEPRRARDRPAVDGRASTDASRPATWTMKEHLARRTGPGGREVPDQFAGNSAARTGWPTRHRRGRPRRSLPLRRPDVLAAGVGAGRRQRLRAADRQEPIRSARTTSSPASASRMVRSGT